MKILTSLSSNEITIRKISISIKNLKKFFHSLLLRAETENDKRREEFQHKILNDTTYGDIKHNMLWHKT